MGLSTIFITVHARDTKDMGDYIEYPVNVSNILAYPPNNNDQHEKAKTRIDLNAAFLPEGQQSTGSQCTVYSSLFTKESPAEIRHLIEEAQDLFMKRAKKNGVVLVM